MQQIYCRACGAFAFKYDGDGRDGGMSSDLAHYADKRKIPLGSQLEIPCGHYVGVPASKYLRIGTWFGLGEDERE